MTHLILDPSTEVQKMAYQFLQGAAKKRTEHLVIEAGVDTEGTARADLPLEILEILQRNIRPGETIESDQEGQVRIPSDTFRLSSLTGISERLWSSARLDASL